MKERILFAGLIFCFVSVSAQNVGIGTTTPNASAQLDITHTSKGLLIPRMGTSDIPSISTPAKGLLVYDSSQNQLMVNMGSSVSPAWQTIVFKSGWSLAGNSGINSSNQFIGNTDNQPLRFRVNNIQAGDLNAATGNIFWGLRSGQANSTGHSNIAVGTDAFKLNISNSNIVSIGDSALFNNGQSASSSFEGSANTAIGSKSLYANTVGYHNTASGYQSLYYNTTGSRNTANGYAALLNNSDGSFNTADGAYSLYSNISGYDNTANGFYTLHNTTYGHDNTANGFYALYGNVAGSYNTAIGYNALVLNSGSLAYYNTAVGGSALDGTTNSQNNTAIGYNAGNGWNLGYNNTILGANCNVNASGLYNCVAIGEAVTCTASSQARIGNSSTGSIGGYANWSNISDGRYKKDINENVKGLDFIMKLRPVTYHLDVLGISKKLNEGRDHEMDQWSKTAIEEKEKIIQSGFVAQEVEQAARETGYDFSGVDKPKNENDFYGLRYAEFVVPLVKAVQEQQLIINSLQMQLEAVKAEIPMQTGKQQQQIEELKKKNETTEQKANDLKKQNEELKISNANQKIVYQELLKRIEKLEHSSASKN